ncbi:MAG: hypothetical protein Q9188_000767 [Gyalolechia gomerana]
MSLACESSQYDTNISQGRQYEYTARGESQAGSITSNGPRVTNLLPLWESQGQTHRAPPSRRPSHTASAWKELASADQTPQGGYHSYRAKPSTEAFEVPHLTHLPLLHFNLLSLRSARQQTVRSEDLSRTPDKAPSEVPTETATYSMLTCKRTKATDSNDNVSMTNSNHQPTSSTPVTEEGWSSSDSSQATERRMPVQSTRLVSGWQQSGMRSPDEGLESNGQQPLECTIRGSSRSNGCLKTLNRGHTRILSGRHAERSDQERGLLMPRGLGSGGECPHGAGTFEVPDMQRPHDMYGSLSSAEAKVALRGNPPPSSCSRSPEVPLVSRNEFPCRASSALTSSTPSSLLDLSVHRLKGWRGIESRSPFAAKRARHAQQAVDVSVHTTSPTTTSSSEYFSIDDSKPGSEDSREDGPIAESTKAPEQAIHDSVALNMSSVMDAATQTNTVERDAGKSTSGWSDNDSVGWHRRVHPRQRISRCVRLERRLKRPTVHKVQVIVSLDGATAMEAQLGRSTINERMPWT